MSFATPHGMSRRHFMQHLAGASAMAGTALTFADTMWANAAELKKNGKGAILMWMGGGPSTMDIWDLKPGAPTGGEFKPISTNVTGVQISEHLPMTAKVMDKLAIVRSMNTREADHGRGRYYMHTGYPPNPNMTHPSYGAVISHELTPNGLEIPPFISVGGASEGPGFLGMAYAPFVVDSNGNVRNLQMSVDNNRLLQRMTMLDSLEKGFVDQSRGQAAEDHMKILKKTLSLMSSKQMEAFKTDKEPENIKQLYGLNGGNTGGAGMMRRGGGAFARGLLMARRLRQAGVPFIEVDVGGWDNHQNIFPTLKDTKLPEIDQGISALVTDLEQQGLLKDTAVIWMGEFSRTPRINGNRGRDHWARAWSVVVGGAGMKTGQAIGATNEDGTEVKTEPYKSEDVLASVCNALGIPLSTTFTSTSGRPMKIANSGKLIKELFA
jgi:Protein of unknown function (DUF1501)